MSGYLTRDRLAVLAGVAADQVGAALASSHPVGES